MRLDRRAGRAQLLPVLDLPDDARPLGADGVGGVGEVAPQLGVGERLARGHREGRHADEGVASTDADHQPVLLQRSISPPETSISARCTTARRPAAATAAPMCIRHE